MTKKSPGPKLIRALTQLRDILKNRGSKTVDEVLRDMPKAKGAIVKKR